MYDSVGPTVDQLPVRLDPNNYSTTRIDDYIIQSTHRIELGSARIVHAAERRRRRG